MKPEKRNVYEKIGHLFYAIAVDHHVQPLVMPELKLLISKDWQPDQVNRGVSDETHVILLTMDALQVEKVTTDEAYETFRAFYVQHPDLFPTDLKRRILDTVVEITQVFTGNNYHLAELEALFNAVRVSKVD